jgi:plastocyanin
MLKAIFGRCIFVGLLLSLFNTSALAADIYFKDVTGKPIPNAVLGFDKSQFEINPKSGDKALGSLNSPRIMDQVDFSFVPRVLVVNQNDWVSFPNSDDVRHHVYSFSEPMPFEIKMFQGSNSSPVQFAKQGIVVLGCNIHDSMIGYIYVQNNEYTFISDKDGKISVDFSKTKNDAGLSATVWHPLLSVTESKRISLAIAQQSLPQTITLEVTLPEEIDASTDNVGDRFRSKFHRAQ